MITPALAAMMCVGVVRAYKPNIGHKAITKGDAKAKKWGRGKRTDTGEDGKEESSYKGRKESKEGSG